MVNGLVLAEACAAAASTPMCILSLESTEDDMFVGCRLARLIPSRSCCFSSLEDRTKQTLAFSFPVLFFISDYLKPKFEILEEPDKLSQDERKQLEFT